MTKDKFLCLDCHSTFKKGLMRGSLLIEVILWLCYLIPGLIYSIWRHNARSVSPCCHSANYIPLISPKAQAIIKSKEVL